MFAIAQRALSLFVSVPKNASRISARQLNRFMIPCSSSGTPSVHRMDRSLERYTFRQTSPFFRIQASVLMAHCCVADRLHRDLRAQMLSAEMLEEPGGNVESTFFTAKRKFRMFIR